MPYQNQQVRVTAAQMLPKNNTNSDKVLIDGNPYYWEHHMWARDYQSRPGEYDHVPICSDPENLSFMF